LKNKTLHFGVATPLLSTKVKNLAIQTKLIELDYSKDTASIKM
jgi:hypothetical protein